MNFLIGSKYQQMKAAACPRYRRMLKFYQEMARVNRLSIRTAEDFEKAIEHLEWNRVLIDWNVEEGRQKKNLLVMNDGTRGNVTLKRIMGHENPESIYFLISALGRKPEPKREQATLNVTIHP